MIKKARVAAPDKGAKDAFGGAFREMQSVIDRAAGKKLLHKNTVARIKKRINRVAKAAAAA